MNMLSNEKINFKSLEENTFKEIMKLGRKIIQDELRMLDKLILDYSKKYRVSIRRKNKKVRRRENKTV